MFEKDNCFWIWILFAVSWSFNLKNCVKKLNVGLWNLENNFILLLQTILEKPDMFTFVITEDPYKIYDKCSYIDYNLWLPFLNLDNLKLFSPTLNLAFI